MSNCSSATIVANDVRLVTGLLDRTDPVSSVTYDGNNRPTEIVYNTSSGQETVTIAYTNGHPIIDGVEYKDHNVNIWEAKLQPSNGNVVVQIDLADGFATRQIDVSAVTEITSTANRISIAVRNWSDLASGQTLYYAEDNTTLTDGWPLAPGEGLTLDIGPGTSVFLFPSTGTIDTRILEVTRT